MVDVLQIKARQTRVKNEIKDFTQNRQNVQKLVKWLPKQTPLNYHFCNKMEAYHTQSGSPGGRCPSVLHVAISGPNNILPGLHLRVTGIPHWDRSSIPETINQNPMLGVERDSWRTEEQKDFMGKD